MKPDGTIVELGVGDPDTDNPKSKDLLYILRSSFKEKARSNQCKAVAMVLDVAVTLPESNEKSDAIQVCIEHVEGYSAEVFFPYQIVSKEIIYGKTFAQQRKPEVFGRN